MGQMELLRIQFTTLSSEVEHHALRLVIAKKNFAHMACAVRRRVAGGVLVPIGQQFPFNVWVNQVIAHDCFYSNWMAWQDVKDDKDRVIWRSGDL